MDDLVADVRDYWCELQRDLAFQTLLTAAVTAEVEEFVRNRSIIEQAKGILIQMLAIDGEKAFAVLLRYSQERNVKVRVLAQMLVDLATQDRTPSKYAPREQVVGTLDELVRAAVEKTGSSD